MLLALIIFSSSLYPGPGGGPKLSAPARQKKKHQLFYALILFPRVLLASVSSSESDLSPWTAVTCSCG